MGLAQKKGGKGLAGTRLNNESNESSGSFVKRNNGKNTDNEVLKSRDLDSNKKNFRKAKNVNKVNINDKNTAKALAGDKNVVKNIKVVNSKDGALFGDVAKVGTSVGASTIVFRLLEVAVNRKNKSKSSDSRGDIGRENIEKELETVRNERDKAISAKKDAEKKVNDAYGVLPSGTRAWLFGFWSYLWGCIGIFGEGKKETKVLAEHDTGLRILFTISGLVFLLTVFVLYYAFCPELLPGGTAGKICVATTLFLPPVGTVLTAGTSLLYKHLKEIHNKQ